eukprot:gene22864-29041_t
MYPIFTVFIYFEYLRYTIIVDTPYNVMAGGFACMILLTGMGFKWTIDLLLKKNSSAPDSKTL